MTARRPATTAGTAPDRGSVTAWTLVLTLTVLAFAGLVLDGGLAVATKADAVSTAQAAARAGARELDLLALRTSGVIRLDPVAARNAAQEWVTSAGLTGTVTATTTVVTVTVTTSRRTQLLSLIGIDEIPVTATASAIAVQT